MERDIERAKKRIDALKKILEEHRYLYNALDKPKLSDAVYDSLKKELFVLEENFPKLVTPDSPTQRVGAVPLEKFEKVRHEVPMLSFADAFSEEEVRSWFQRLSSYVGRKIPEHFYCELKIDGFAVELEYKNGLFVRGSTRGDGMFGEDVTQNLKTIEAIPLKLRSSSDVPKHLIVRGEVFMNKKEFARVNADLAKEGREPYANPRNLAAGTIRQLDSKIPASRKLDSFAYDIALGNEPKLHSTEHDLLKKWGFKTNSHNKKCDSLSDVFLFWRKWENERGALPYEVDGVVIILDDNDIFREGGVVGKRPRAAVAYKFSPEEATTQVLDIKVQVGRTGILTPVAHLAPAMVRGVTITHATLHNYDEIKRLGIKIGDTVVVTRSGDVIPKITSVLTNLRVGSERAFKMPVQCPVDKSPVIREGAYYKCSNKKCGEVLRRSLRHFVSRPAFNIEGLGGKTIERFLDEGLITDAADIFSLKREDIASLARFGEKSADNITKEIEARKKVPLHRFLYALGILHVGEETASLLADFVARRGKLKYSTRPEEIFSFVEKRSLDELEEISDVGPEVSKSIYAWFHDKKNKELLSRLSDRGIEVLPEVRRASGALSGKTFVLTGTLALMSRDRAKELIRERGGSLSGTVSSKTDFVVAGADPGSKLKKAKELGVAVIDEKHFLSLLK